MSLYLVQISNKHYVQFRSPFNFDSTRLENNIHLTSLYYRHYVLDYPFGGNSHVVFKGYFFYNVKDTRRIIKYHLRNDSSAALDLPIAGPTNTSAEKLYTGNYNTVDFSVDDNGLWLIFAVTNSNNTAVMKVRIL